MDNEEYAMPGEETKNNVVSLAFRVRKKLKDDYTTFCQKKGITRSKRLRDFMIYELKKDEIAKAEAEKKRLEEAAKIETSSDTSSEELFDPFKDHSNDILSKPKGLNTSEMVN